MKPKPGKPVCKFHPKCNKETCDFEHPHQLNRNKSNQPPSSKGMDENLCRHFLRGKCAYGTGCLRSHEVGTNEKDMGAYSTHLQPHKRSGATEAINSNPTFSVVSEDADNAMAEEKELCSLYLVGQCTVVGCEFDHPGEKVTTQEAFRPSSSSKPGKSPTIPTYSGSSPLDAPDTPNWTDVDEDKAETEAYQDSRNNDHPQTRSSASKSAISHERPSSSSHSALNLQAPLTTRAPTFQVTQPTQYSEPKVTSELQYYPHISQVMLHWCQFADPLARADLAFCKLHAQDKCTKAESCTFRHSLTVGEYFSLFHDPQPTLATLEREGDPIVTEAITNIQPVISPTVVYPASLSLQTYHRPSVSAIVPNMASEQKYFSKECSFFRSGNCRNGGHCPYTHVQPQTPAAAEVTIESNEDDNWSPISTQTAKINKPCKFFNSTYGYCRSGSDCPFLHQSDGPSGTRLTLEATYEMDRSANGGNKEDDNGWGQDWGENDRLANTTGDTYNHDEREDDQGVNEWSKAQNTTSWETNTHEERLAYRSPQWQSTNRPCYQFKEGFCRWGTSCKFAHDNEPTGLEYRNATRNLQMRNDNQSPARQEVPFGTSGRPSMSPDSAETHEFEPGEENNAEEEPEEDPPLFLSPQTSDKNEGDNGWNTTWSPAQGPIKLPWVKSNVYCLAYGKGHCGKGDTCRFRHADSSVTPPQQTTSPSFHIDAPENEGFSSMDMVPASTNIPHEPEEIPLVSNIPDHLEFEKLVMNATVSFRPDFVPVSIEPLAESHELRLSNLPSDITIENVQALVKPSGIVLENTLRTSQRTASVRVDFATAKQARDAFEYFRLQEYSGGDRKFVASFANLRLRLRPADKDTLKVSWPKPTLVGWSHYSTIGKAKEEAARLNGVIIKGRKIQVEFCSPSKRQKDNFAIKISNLSLETTKDEFEQLCKGHTLTTGFDKPTYHVGASRETIKEEFHSFGDLAFEKVSDSDGDQGPNSHLLVFFPREAITQEVMKEFSSRKLSCIGHQSLEIRPVFFAQYYVSCQIFDVVRQEIEQVKEGGALNYSIQYEENISRKYHIRLISPSMKYAEFVEANAELHSLLQGKVAITEDGKIIWDDYFEMPTKALQLFLTQANSIIPDERTRRIRLFGSKAEQKRAMERLLKLLSKVRSQRHEVIVPRGSIHPLVDSQFETIQKDIGVNKVSFDPLNSKIIVRGTNEECSDIQNLVDSLNSPTVYKTGCCEICHLLPGDPNILACLHVYCTPCLRMAFRSASHGPLRCIAITNSPSIENPGQCLDHIPYIDEILPPPERDRLLLSSFLAHIRDSDELFICPSIGCKAVYRTGPQGLNLHCSRCGTEICSFCQTLAHIGLSCSDMQGRM